MMQVLKEKHAFDLHGNPAGGETRGLGIKIRWQDGPLGNGNDRKEPNGAFVEGVLKAALGRLEHYQSSRFNCAENALAIIKIQEALNWLQQRTTNRERNGVEGTHKI